MICRVIRPATAGFAAWTFASMASAHRVDPHGCYEYIKLPCCVQASVPPPVECWSEEPPHGDGFCHHALLSVGHFWGHIPLIPPSPLGYTTIQTSLEENGWYCRFRLNSCHEIWGCRLLPEVYTWYCHDEILTGSCGGAP